MALETFKFESDVVHYAGIMHQAGDELLRLNTSEKDESTLQDAVPLYAIVNSDSLPLSIHTIAHEERRARNVHNTKLSDDETECDSTTIVKLLQN